MQNRLTKIDRLLALLGKSLLIAVIVVLLGSYIFFCPPVLTSTNGGFILFPMPPGEEYTCESVNNIKRDEQWFKNQEGLKLHSWFFKSPNKNAPVVLFSHGNAGNIGHRLMLAKYIMDAGASVFLFDYRSYGKSEGEKSLHGIVVDTRAAYDYLTKERHIAPSRIVLYGESIGGGPACELARMVPVAGIILDSSFTSLLHVAKKKVGVMNIYPDFFQPIPALDNVSYLKGNHPPLLIVHGKLDEVIPFSEGEENYQAAAQPKEFLVLPNSTHNWKEPDFPAYEEGIRKFLQNIQSARVSATAKHGVAN